MLIESQGLKDPSVQGLASSPLGGTIPVLVLKILQEEPPPAPANAAQPQRNLALAPVPCLRMNSQEALSQIFSWC